MPQIKIAVQLSSLRLPVRKAIGVAARLGASAVEFDARGEIRPQELGQTGLRELKRLLEDSGLNVSAVGFHTRRGYDVAEELDQRIAATKAAMKFAADLRAGCVVNQIGHVLAEADGPGCQIMSEALHDLANYAQHVGVILAAQTGTESGADLGKLLATLPPTIGVDLDPGNLIINGFSPREAVDALGERIVHVHARDGVRDLARGRGLEVPLGRGTADFPLLLATLEEHGYRGYFTVVRHDSAEAQMEIAAAIEYLKSL